MKCNSYILFQESAGIYLRKIGQNCLESINEVSNLTPKSSLSCRINNYGLNVGEKKLFCSVCYSDQTTHYLKLCIHA